MRPKSHKEETRDDLLKDIRASLDKRIEDKRVLLILIKHEEYWDEMLPWFGLG